jgi:solute carrier family 45 protein 1/2/4
LLSHEGHDSYDTDCNKVNTVTILLAVAALAVVDFAVNAVQASCRALMVDTLPIPQQQHGSAWGELFFLYFFYYYDVGLADDLTASRMIAVGNIVGYFA